MDGFNDRGVEDADEDRIGLFQWDPKTDVTLS